MLGDISNADKIYIVTGYTDMRKSIDGLCAVVEQELRMNPSENSLFFLRKTQRPDQSAVS